MAFPTRFFQRLRCRLFGHRWDFVRPYGNADYGEWMCRRCGGQGAPPFQGEPPPRYQAAHYDD
jgi:hypothetical protein